MTTLTVANSAFTLATNSPATPVPIPMVGYAADDAFDVENIAPNEVMPGVDGRLSGGYVYVPVKLKFTLQADSPSILFLDLWWQSMGANKDAFTASATIVAPSLGKIWTFTKGFLTGYKPIPSGKKLFQAQPYEITFESMITAAV